MAEVDDHRGGATEEDVGVTAAATPLAASYKPPTLPSSAASCSAVNGQDRRPRGRPHRPQASRPWLPHRPAPRPAGPLFSPPCLPACLDQDHRLQRQRNPLSLSIPPPSCCLAGSPSPLRRYPLVLHASVIVELAPVVKFLRGLVKFLRRLLPREAARDPLAEHAGSSLPGSQLGHAADPGSLQPVAAPKLDAVLGDVRRGAGDRREGVLLAPVAEDHAEGHRAAPAASSLPGDVAASLLLLGFISMRSLDACREYYDILLQFEFYLFFLFWRERVEAVPAG